ncbi:hypothetical protein ACFSR9_03370 [Deinococcus taklimakanensis]|uniref:Uncharacterized protein n=1 Tax=Deinococcus taklimakanensis TaxID=536443 RepID=A0ABW5P242_9DEIO
MQEISLTWVPGTLDTVRARLGQRTVEISSTRLARIFGPQALNDLYLKGRAVMRPTAQQLSLFS